MINLDECLDVMHQVWPLLRPYEDHVVVVGGIAAHLYGLDARFAPPDLLRTFETSDVDIGIPLPLAIPSDETLLDHCIAQGLHHELAQSETGDRISRVEFQPLGRHAGSPYLEFLAQRGERIGGPEPRIRPRLSMYAWMLWWENLRLPLPGGLGHVRLPHPLAYALQKVLVKTESNVQTRLAKHYTDALYVLGGYAEHWDAFFARLPKLAAAHPDGAAGVRLAIRTWREVFAPGTAGRSVGPSMIAKRLLRRQLVPADVERSAAYFGQEVLERLERSSFT